MILNDTIVAIATAIGNAGISIIRISGKNSFNTAELLFSGKTSVLNMATHTIQYGKILDPKSEEIIDEVILLKMESPRTYTREDVIEIHCHGGVISVQRILDALLESGLRLAEPGEFTKRAFLNGRIDLSQAEAVMDIIQAKTDKSSNAAFKQLEGNLSMEINGLRKRLLDLLAHIEVTLDYPEYNDEHITAKNVSDEINLILSRIDKLLDKFNYGRILRDGVSVVIAGKPNVGKSSLMNKLIGKNKSIVTEIPGTTRDIIEEYINIKGIPVKLLDTAGLRRTEDTVEAIGVMRTEEAIENADFLILMFDAATGFDYYDEQILDIAMRYSHKPIQWIINKIDIYDSEKIKSIKTRINNENILMISVSEENGINEIEKCIYDGIIKGNIDTGSDVLVSNTRHKNLLNQTKEDIIAAINANNMGMTLDCIALDLHNAAESLGKITGQAASEDLINTIFSRFCIGK